MKIVTFFKAEKEEIIKAYGGNMVKNMLMGYDCMKCGRKTYAEYGSKKVFCNYCGEKIVDLLKRECPECGGINNIPPELADSGYYCRCCGKKIGMAEKKSVPAEQFGADTIAVSEQDAPVENATVIEGKGTLTREVVLKYSNDLRNIVIKGFDAIGNDAFSQCKTMLSVVIPDTVRRIGKNAFARCMQLRSVYIPASVESIGDNAFWYCESLKAVNVSADNKNFCSVDGVLFSKDRSKILKFPEAKECSEYYIPDGVEAVGVTAFACSRSLVSIIIPDTVAKIGFEAFAWCRNLMNVKIPDSVTSIASGAFKSCSADMRKEAARWCRGNENELRHIMGE